MANINTQFGKVGVLFGGRSAEREVSLMSGKGVLEALRSKGIDAEGFDPATQSLADLAGHKFSRVFIALHGRYGEDGTIQGALEQLGIPYTGPGVQASAIAMDKIMTKRIWISYGLPTPRFEVLDAQSTTDQDLVRVAKELGLPLILKAPHEGSTIGLSKVESEADLHKGFADCTKYDDVLLAESFVKGREFTIPVLGKGKTAHALPVIEIRAPQGNYDYQHKYFGDETKYLCPAPLDEALTKKMQDLAVNAFNALGCRGWSRVDVMLSENNEPTLLEINTSPGMTGHSLVPMAAKQAGMSYEDLCCDILGMADLDLHPSPDWVPVY